MPVDLHRLGKLSTTRVWKIADFIVTVLNHFILHIMFQSRTTQDSTKSVHDAIVRLMWKWEMGSVPIELYIYKVNVSMSSDVMSIRLKERYTMRCLQVDISIHAKYHRRVLRRQCTLYSLTSNLLRMCRSSNDKESKWRDEGKPRACQSSPNRREL